MRLKSIKGEIAERLYVYGAPDSLKDELDRQFTFKNPAYVAACKFSPWGPPKLMPETIRLLERAEDEIAIPRGVDPVQLSPKARLHWNRIQWADYRKSSPISFPPLRVTANSEQTVLLKDFESAVNACQRPFGNFMYVAPTSAGKTILQALIARSTGQRTLVLCLTDLIKKAWYGDLLLAFGLKPKDIGIIQQKKWRIGDHFTLASIQTLARRKTLWPELFNQIGCVIADECFPKGILIDNRPIETIKVGEYVRSFSHIKNSIEFRKVVSVFQSRPQRLVELSLSGGKKIVCTPDHPFWNGESYISACNTKGARIFSLFTKSKSPRRKKDKTFEFIRVDDITVFERGSKEFIEKLHKTDTVFNLEIEGNNNYFAEGCLVHNCQSLQAPSVYEFIQNCPAKYIIGATATPKEENFMLYSLLGNPKKRLFSEQRKTETSLALNFVETVETNFQYSYDSSMLDMHALSEAMSVDEERNAIIVRQCLKQWNDGESLLIVTKRVAHVHVLAEMLQEAGIEDVNILTGNTNVDRTYTKKLVRGILNRDIRCVVATIPAVKLGANLNPLSRLHLTMPVNEDTLEQLIGRIRRRADKKEDCGLIYYLDRHVHYLFHAFNRKATPVFRKLKVPGYQNVYIG